MQIKIAIIAPKIAIIVSLKRSDRVALTITATMIMRIVTMVTTVIEAPLIT